MEESTSDSLSPDRIQKFAFAFAPPLILEAAIRLQLFDLLVTGAKTVDQLVEDTKASARGLRAVLNALVGLEMLQRDGDRYCLTAESAKYLVSDAADFQGGMFRHISRQMLPNWSQLYDSVQTGEPAQAVNQQSVGAKFFRQFVEDLFPRGYPAARALAESLQIDQCNQPCRVLDLAAGSGVWSIALAERSTQVRVTAVDWSDVIPVTQQMTRRRNVAAQYEFVEGDLLTAQFGNDYNVATLGHILHSEGEDRSRQLLAKVFAALAPGGTLMIAEFVPNDDRSGPVHALVFAVNMLVHTEQGDTFTFAEIGQWLAEAGFVNTRQLQAPAPSPLILADKP